MDELSREPRPEPDAVELVFSIEPIWVVAARVVGTRPYGEGGAQTRRGLRMFGPGAKVCVVGGHPGMGLETVTVVGRHRQTKKYVTVDVQARHLVDWTVELSYSPHVIRVALHGPSNSFFPADPGERRRALETLALRFNDRDVIAQLTGGPADGGQVSLGPGTPPGQLLRPSPARPVDAVRYLLRSWDAERAFYDYAPSEPDGPFEPNAKPSSDGAGAAAGDAAVQGNDGPGEVGPGA